MTSKKLVHLFEFANIVPYGKSLSWQRDILAHRISNSTLRNQHLDSLIILEHAHVFTLGRRSKPSDINLVQIEQIKRSHNIPSIDIESIERGGQITYHGPGQLVVYPLLDLNHFTKDLHWYVTNIEQVIINTLRDFQIDAFRVPTFPGVWVGSNKGDDFLNVRKIAQVGMNCNKWTTTHGFALNVNPDLSFFDCIVPCGIKDRQVTSMKKEREFMKLQLSNELSMKNVKESIKHHFQEIFECEFQEIDALSTSPIDFYLNER
jgi:lipoyl(octanoyl) transferase